MASSGLELSIIQSHGEHACMYIKILQPFFAEAIYYNLAGSNIAMFFFCENFTNPLIIINNSTKKPKSNKNYK
jgi:hypothetical protein